MKKVINIKKIFLFIILAFIISILPSVYAEEIDINSEEITVSNIQNYTYTGSKIKPEITIQNDTTPLIKDTDYTLEYINNVNSGTATIVIEGINNYTGIKNVYFQIEKKSIKDLKYLNLKNYTFSNINYTQDLIIQNNEKKLTKDIDYTISYKNNKSAGTATAIINGIGNYSDTKQLNFIINKRNISTLSISNIAAKTYTGAYIKPSITLKYNGSTVAQNNNYKISYKNNKKIGTATVTIAGINNYIGTVKKTFQIIPKKTKLSSASIVKNKKVKLKWKKSKNTTGYKVYIAKENGSYSLYKTIKGLTKTTYTLSIKKGVTYKFYVQTYKKVKGKTYISDKSNIKTVRITTTAEKNAQKRAKSYLKYMAFSREGLIHQLEYEKFTHSQAVYGVDHSGANWNSQAIKCAKSYLNTMAFSREDLIDQLEYEKFTHAQAVYGVDRSGANWYSQAVKCAKSYLKYFAFSRGELIDQLEFEGFTYDQAVYAANQVGL